MPDSVPTFDLASLAMRVELLAGQLAERDSKISEQTSQISEQTSQIAELHDLLATRDAELVQLRGELARLSEQVSQHSGNSHLPPSSDPPGHGGKAGRNRRKPSGRTRGGQKGHKGSHRSLLPPEQVDEFIDLYPPVCLECSSTLPREFDASALRYQQVDLIDCKKTLREWRRHEVRCPACLKTTQAAYDKNQIPSGPFGPGLAAGVAFLTGGYHLSRRKTRQLLSEFCGIEISLGSISALEKQVSTALEKPHQEAMAAVQEAAVKHTDATSFYRAGTLRSLWTIASAMVTVYWILENGRTATIRPLFGEIKGILVSDRATVFGFWAMGNRQICHAHLLRKFVAFSERDEDAGAIGKELLEQMSLMFEYWHSFKDGELTREKLIEAMRPVQEHMEQTLQRAVDADIPRMSGSCADILKHKDALWTFVTRDSVEPTNNHAELMLRDFVLWRKRSFGCQSESGERFAERIMTTVMTLRKQGKKVLDFLVEGVRANLMGESAPSLLRDTS